MDKPSLDLSEISIGKIFQIDPCGKEDIHLRYGGSFIIATEYFEWGIQGYLALVNEMNGLTRYRGFAYVRAKWKDIELCGSAMWVRDHEEYSESKQNV